MKKKGKKMMMTDSGREAPPVIPSKQPKGTIFGAPNTPKTRAMVSKMMSRNYR